MEESRGKMEKKNKNNLFQQFSCEAKLSNTVTVAEEAKADISIGRRVISQKFLTYCPHVES